MSYLSNNSRVSSIAIGGTDYTSNLVSWTASDASANKQGCITTTGQVILGTKPGGVLIEDYDRNNFRRGDQVILTMTEPGGSTYRHPRGLLYVISTSYDVEAEELTVEIGCRLSLMALLDEFDDLLSIVPIPLDPAQENYQSCCASFASAGKYVYQDNNGDLQSGLFFDGDNLSGTAAGEWVSVLGVTTNSVSPLAGTGAIPDQIKLSYQVPSDVVATDQSGRVDTETTTSYFFLAYPIVDYVRQNSDATEDEPNGTLDNAGGANTVEYDGPAISSSTSCGNAPSAPEDNGTPSCNEGYELVQSATYFPAIRTDEVVTRYDGPSAQVSYSRRETYGPRIEANGQYWADNFAYCRQLYGSGCDPDGQCPYDGLDNTLLTYTETFNFFDNRSGKVARTIVDTYDILISGAQPTDWRAGTSNGQILSFDSSFLLNDTMYRVRRNDTIYYTLDNTNVQQTTVYESVTTNQVGIKGGQSLDALRGIKTRTVRRSTSNATLDVAPDIVNTPTTSTVEITSTLPLFTGRYVTPPAESGPYEIDEQIPVPLLFDTQGQIDTAVEDYSNYLIRFTKGDVFGLQIGEGLRSDVVTGWRPGMPFRYYDPVKGKLLAMRMDATSWGVDTNSAAFVVNGIWNGFSNGTVTIPSNTVGGSLPDLDGNTPTPPGATVPPSVDDETGVDSGTIAFEVDVHFMFQSIAETFAVDGVSPPPPSAEDVNVKRTMTCYVEGIIVGPGDVLSTEADGGIPLEYEGSIIVSGATIVDPDLFS
ncbi:pyocin R2 [Synechococcus phage S-CRES2]|nr:pyocin R2 [Synechococcus phage S-CRES2]